MTVTDFLLPVFVLVFMTLILLVMTAVRRVSNLRSGEVRADDIALGQPGWPEKTTQYGNAFKNQLELPVLFYVLIAFILTLGWLASGVLDMWTVVYMRRFNISAEDNLVARKHLTQTRILQRVAKVLIAQGYRRVRPLLGGLDAWDAAGYPVERLPAPAGVADDGVARATG